MCAEDEEGSLVSSVIIFSDSYFSGPEISVTGRKMKLRLFWRKRFSLPFLFPDIYSQDLMIYF